MRILAKNKNLVDLFPVFVCLQKMAAFDIASLQRAFIVEIDENLGKVTDGTKLVIENMTIWLFHQLIKPFGMSPHSDSRKFDKYTIDKFLKAYRKDYVNGNRSLLPIYAAIGHLPKVVQHLKSVTRESVIWHAYGKACAFGHLDIVKYFEEIGHSDAEGSFPVAAGCGQLEVVKFLSPKISDPNPAMERAIHRRQFDVVKFLSSEMGASILCGMSTVYYDNDVGLLRFLVEINPAEIGGCLEAVFKFEHTPADIKIEMIKYLLARGGQLTEEQKAELASNFEFSGLCLEIGIVPNYN